MVFLKSDCKKVSYSHWHWPCLQNRFRNPGGFHRQLRALRVRSAFERVFAWAASCKTKYVKFACKLGNAYVSCGIFKSPNQ